MLGLIIYQALRREELDKLAVEDLDLEDKIVSVPGTRRSTARTLDLVDVQLLTLEEYVFEVRPMLSKESSDKLFLTLEGGKNLKNVLASIMGQLKRKNNQVRNASQLRQSRIRVWLESEDLREVQHKAGHRYISSTERYGMLHVRDLKKQLDKYHPLG